jgi:hypothetical protein
MCFVLIVRRPEQHLEVDCTNCCEYLSALTAKLSPLYSPPSCPAFLRAVPTAQYATRGAPESCDPLAPVRAAISDLRSTLALTDITLRRWLVLFANGSSGTAEPPRDAPWKLDSNVYPTESRIIE